MEDQRDVEEENGTKERRKTRAKKIRVEKNKRCQHSECKNSYSYLFLSQQLIKYVFECRRLCTYICTRVCVCVCGTRVCVCVCVCVCIYLTDKTISSSLSPDCP